MVIFAFLRRYENFLSSHKGLLFSSFALFLNLPHLLPGDELIVCPETAELMQGVGKSAAPVEWHVALAFDVREVHLLLRPKDLLTGIFIPQPFFQDAVN